MPQTTRLLRPAAARLAFHILRAPPEDAAALAASIVELRQRLGFVLAEDGDVRGLEVFHNQRLLLVF